MTTGWGAIACVAAPQLLAMAVAFVISGALPSVWSLVGLLSTLAAFSLALDLIAWWDQRQRAGRGGVRS